MKRLAITGMLLFVGGITIGSALTPPAERATASSQGQRVCIHKKTGVMRLASVKKCSGSETSTIFGAPGATGSEGPAGPAGSASSAAVVKTKNVTLKYTGSSSSIGSCGDGTAAIGSSGRIFSAWSVETSYLNTSWNWKSMYDCSITLKVVDE
jgi:hypothetical protein